MPTAYAMAAGLLVAALAVGFATARDLGITLVGYLALPGLLLAVAQAPGRSSTSWPWPPASCCEPWPGPPPPALPISEWFFIVTSFGALLVVVGKRESELHNLGAEAGQVRPTLAVYTPEFLRYLRSVATGVVLVAYCLWAFESATRGHAGAVWFQLSIVPFTAAIFQYALMLEQGGGEHPELVLTTDRAILASGAVWAIVYGYAVYRT